MGLGAKLQLRQSQSLVMTPQLLQSIRLLQLTRLELEGFIDAEIEKNPLLERAGSDEVAGDEADPVSSERGEEDGVDTWMAEPEAADGAELPEDRERAADNLFTDSGETRAGPGSSRSGPSAMDALPDIGEMAAGRPDLRRHVEEQIALTAFTREERAIAAAMADALDDDGYMRADPETFAVRLGATSSACHSVLERLQALDPPGVFARDLSECLALQLAERDRLDPAMQAMLANLELVARRDFAQLRRLCDVDEGDLLDMLGEIKSLDPRPGLAFSNETSEIVVPDVVVRAAPDGSWAVELNADALPRLLVDHAYAARVTGALREREDRDFVNGCLHSATWLVRSLDQRARTILKVASEIVRLQDEFLVHGVRRLRPLNLRTVADAIGMHESTVSRVTANKYMLTPRGMFEFRYFFTVGLPAAGGGAAHSSESIRDRIRELIEAETPSSVLSDDALADMLRRDGVEIARRTVAKYREGMSIASSVQRRREKRAHAARTA